MEQRFVINDDYDGTFTIVDKKQTLFFMPVAFKTKESAQALCDLMNDVDQKALLVDLRPDAAPLADRLRFAEEGIESLVKFRDQLRREAGQE